MADKKNTKTGSGNILDYGTVPAPDNMTVKLYDGPNNPYHMNYRQTKYERAADVQPNEYFSILDRDGKIKEPYRLDPSQSASFKKMSDIANSSDLSPWASLQMQQNQMQTGMQRDRANAQSLGANQQAMQKLMSTGGGSNSGAAAFLAAQSQRDQMMQNQNIGAESAQNALGIMQSDALNKQNMLGQVANTETGALSGNVANAIQDTQGANLFSGNRYNQLMQAWGAEKTAEGQRAAAGGGGGK